MDKYNDLLLKLSERLWKVAPDLVSAVVIFFSGIALAFLFRKSVFFLITSLARVPSSRVARLAKSKYLNSFASTVSKLVFWAAVIVSSSLVLQIFGVQVAEEWMRSVTNFLPSLLGSALVIVSGFLLARFIRDLLRETTTLTNFAIQKSLPSVLYYAICSVSILIALEQLGIEIGFLTSAILVLLLCVLAGGAISFGIGSAPIVTNLLSTFYLRKRLKVGQTIICTEFTGTVVEIGETCVFLRNDDGIQSVPSKQLNDLRFTVTHARHR